MPREFTWVVRSPALWEYVRGDEVFGSVKLDYSCCGGAKVLVSAGGVELRGTALSVTVGKRLVGIVVAGMTGDDQEQS